MKLFIISATNLLIWILSIILSEPIAWFLLNISILIGIVGHIYTWKKIKHILIGLGIGIVKFVVTSLQEVGGPYLTHQWTLQLRDSVRSRHSPQFSM